MGKDIFHQQVKQESDRTLYLAVLLVFPVIIRPRDDRTIPIEMGVHAHDIVLGRYSEFKRQFRRYAVR